MKHKRNRIISIVLSVIGILFVLGTCVFLTVRPDVSAFKERVQAIFARNTEEDSEEEDENTAVDDAVEEALSNMTLEQKAAQLFIIEPEQITGMAQVIAAGDTTKQAIGNYPVGGFIYFEQNMIDPAQAKEMLANVQTYEKDTVGVNAFIAINEENSTVSQFAGNEAFTLSTVAAAQEIGASGDTNQAAAAGTALGGYLSELGFNLNLAPNANVLTEENAALAAVSFGADAETVSSMAITEADAMKKAGVLGVFKNFPLEVSADGSAASSQKTADELKEAELVPITNAVKDGAEVIMLSNTSFPNITGDNIPASLSKDIVTGILRDDLGFKGLVITDAQNEAAITGSYTPAQAAVLAIQAGADVILQPQDFNSAYQAVLSAVSDGTITEDRIDESVRRILDVKMNVIGE